MQQGTTGGDDVRRRAEKTASTVVEQAQQTAEVQLSSQKDQAASTLHSLAESIREGGHRMRDEQPQVASFAEQAAERVDQASRYVREHEVRDFVREAENFARREPLIFLGGAFALGFLAARFLKASSPSGGRSSQSGGRGQRDWYAVGPGHAGGSGYGRDMGYAGSGVGAYGQQGAADTFVGGQSQALGGMRSGERGDEAATRAFGAESRTAGATGQSGQDSQPGDGGLRGDRIGQRDDQSLSGSTTDRGRI